MPNNRTNQLFRNSTAGMIALCIQFFVTFFSRKVFIESLGVELLGVGDLYTNIISLLSLADMGIETVFMYSLYKPIAEGDHSTINAMIKVIKKFYRRIALIILIIGLAFVPFIPLIAKNTTVSNSRLIIYYLFFLANCVLSYLLVYRSALLQADQKVHVVKITKALSQLFFGILQIILIYVFKNYYAYLITMVAGTLFNNITLNQIAKKKYSYLSNSDLIEEDNSLKAEITKNTKSVFVYKIGTMVINSTDNIFISAILGAAAVGFYSNYHTIIIAMTSIIGILNSSLVPGVGNFVATVKESKSRITLFDSFLTVYFLLATIFAGAFLVCSEQIITVWIGKDFILDKIAVLTIAISFYFQCIAHPIWIFRETCGLFDSIRGAIISMAVLNVIFSLVGGLLWGIAGIIGATTVSRVLTLFWYEPKLLNRKVFNGQYKWYWKKWVSSFLISITIIFVFYVGLHDFLNSFPGVILKTILLSSVSCAVFYMINRNRPEGVLIKNKISNLLAGKNIFERRGK